MATMRSVDSLFTVLLSLKKMIIDSCVLIATRVLPTPFFYSQHWLQTPQLRFGKSERSSLLCRPNRSCSCKPLRRGNSLLSIIN